MGAENNETNKTEQNIDVEPEVNENKTEQKEENKVNVEETKTQGVNEFLKVLGVEKKEDLQAIVDAYNEQVESRKSDLEKANDSNKTLTKRLVEEKERADIAEAKLAAISLGAKKELVDDLVVIAKAKITGDKKIIDIVEEIKKSNVGSVYFESEETKENSEEPKNKTITRTNSKVQEKSQKEQKEETKGSGLAERLFKNKQKTKNHYFSKK